MVMAVIVERIFLELEFCFPVVIDLVCTIDVHIEAVIVLVELRRAVSVVILVMVILHAHKSIHGKLACDAVLEILDVLRILIRLLLQRRKLGAILASELVEHGLVTNAEALLLHGLRDNRCHLVARHGAVALERAVAHALDDAVLREEVERVIRPMALRDITEAVRAGLGCKCRARDAERQARQDGKSFLVEFHVFLPFLF